MEAVSRQFSKEDMADAAGAYGLDFRSVAIQPKRALTITNPNFAGIWLFSLPILACR